MSKTNKPKSKDDKPQKEKESKVVKFKRVVTPRVNKALKAINLVGNCSTKDYAYSNDQVEKIMESLFNAVKGVNQRYIKGTTADNSFTL